MIHLLVSHPSWLLIYFILFLLILYIFIRTYIKIKYKFWYLQPVYHVYDIFNWVTPSGIIDPEIPKFNKYTNLINIKTYDITEINEVLLDRSCNFINSYYVQSPNAAYNPQKYNIVEYLKHSNQKSYITLYNEPKLVFEQNKKPNGGHNGGSNSIMYDEIISIITGRPLHITLRKNPTFEIYYVDNLCVHPLYRNKGIAPEMIQTHYYNMRNKNKNIQTCLFKREGKLNMIVPLVAYNTYLFNITNITNMVLNNAINNVIEINTDQLFLFNDFISLQKKDNQFECIIMPDMSNIINLLKSQNIFIYGIINKGELMAVYIFRRPNLFYNKEESVECFLTLYNKKISDVQLFINGFIVSLHKLKQKINNSYLLIEELCDNDIIIDHFIHNKNIILDFTSPTAFFLYNYCSYTVNSKKSIIFY